MDNKSDTVSLQARMDKANSRLTNLIAMRADGEISKEEYQSMRNPIDAEIKELQKALDAVPTDSGVSKGLDLEGIRSTLNTLIDFSGSTISHDVINQFVYMEWLNAKEGNVEELEIPYLSFTEENIGKMELQKSD